MTLTYSPPSYASVNSPLMWIFYDANAIDVTKINYKYVAELWIAGVKVYTERSYPRPLGSYGVFDFSTVIRNYVAATFNPATGTVAQVSSANEFRTADIVVKAREEYDGYVGAIIFTDTARYFFNHYNERQEILTAIVPFQNKPLSNRSENIEISKGVTQYFIPYFSTGLTPFNVYINGVTTTITPTSLNACTLINIYIPGVDTYHVIFDGASSLPPVIATEDLQGITTETGDYLITENGGIGTIFNPRGYTVNVVCVGFYQNYLIHFLNKYGAFETMLFNKVSRKRKQIERKDYKQQPYRIDAAGALSYGTTIRNEQRVVFASRSEEKLRLQTNFIADPDYLWLSELVNSPQVYLEDLGICYPVVITDTNYEYKQHIVDSLTTLSIEVDFASSTNTQYR